MEAYNYYEKTAKILVFLAGFVTCLLILGTTSYYAGYDYSDNSNDENPSLLNTEASSYTDYAPSDWINLSQIKVYKDSIVIALPNASLSEYASSGSMRPTFDIGANGIRLVPRNAEDIQIGDIITYGENNIVHRVIEKGEDEKGHWFMAKGDNNLADDGEKIRFSDIKYVTVGVLY